ncbi:MAG: glycosyltransferase, partial [Methylococcales bacterium]
DPDWFSDREISEIQRVELRRNLGVDPDDRVILFVGRIGREKRVLELFQALYPLLQSQPRTRLLLVGDGPELNELKTRCRNSHVEKQVICTGYVERDSIAGIYQLADLFVTASLSEVHPMTMLEAMFCSLPVIARKDESYLDSVQAGRNGYLLDSDVELGEKVQELLADPDKRRSFGRESRRIADRFTGLGHARRMEEFYEEILCRFEHQVSARKMARYPT